jgi:hypothetical protein
MIEGVRFIEMSAHMYQITWHYIPQDSRYVCETFMIIMQCPLICDSMGKSVDLYLKSAIEGIVIKWATQIDEVLKEDSSCAYAKESNPTPRFGMCLCSDFSPDTSDA